MGGLVEEPLSIYDDIMLYLKEKYARIKSS